MRVFVTGATGFIGRALVPSLRREGHSIVAWVRSEARARARIGAEVDTLGVSCSGEVVARTLEQCDAVINLAGEPILGKRWTTAQRARLWSSRVDVTKRLVEAMSRASPRPRVLVSGSAVGFYGDRGNARLVESSPSGRDFLAQLCEASETAASDAERLGVRTVILRSGIVLGRDGGALAQMLPAFLAGAGGPIGSGRQYFPWIHLYDLVAVILAALSDPRFTGAVNVVAPHQVTSREFAAALGRALHRPAVISAPALALRALFGEGARVLLASQRVDAAALRARGWTYEFPTIDAALADIVSPVPMTISPATMPDVSGDTEASRRYLAARRPAFVLRARTLVDAPVEDTFGFFSHAENLALMTPAAMRFSIRGKAPAIAEGAVIEHRLRVGALPIRWRTLIASLEPGRRFVDVQTKGPYRCWWHEHTFRADGNRTVMDDRVYYAPPLGMAGRLANRMLIVPALRRIFRYRADVIRLRFGRAPHRRAPSSSP